MRYILAFLAAAIILPGVCQAECGAVGEAASRFMNDYVKFVEASSGKKTTENRSQWVKRSTIVTDNFKAAYKKLLNAASKEEGGLSADPILAAQDYPDQGYEVLSCDEKSGYVTLQGVGAPGFNVVVKVIQAKGGWLIEGAGVINIPRNKRAAR